MVSEIIRSAYGFILRDFLKKRDGDLINIPNKNKT